MSCCAGQATAPTVLADADTATARLATCATCEKRTVTFTVATCGVPLVGGLLDPDACGCILDWKVRFAGQKCPQGKW